MMVRSPSLALVLPRPAAESGAKPAGPSQVDFEGNLHKAVEALSGTQQKAETEAVKLARGEGNLHTAALAVEQADVAMKLAVKVRNKVVETYQDIMRMGV